MNKLELGYGMWSWILKELIDMDNLIGFKPGSWRSALAYCIKGTWDIAKSINFGVGIECKVVKTQTLGKHALSLNSCSSAH